MSDDFKCPEGWTEVTVEPYFITIPNADCEYKLIRRPKQKPMPKLEPGMGVEIKRLNGIFGVAEVHPMHFFVWSGCCRTGYFPGDVSKVWNDKGDLLWERSK